MRFFGAVDEEEAEATEGSVAGVEETGRMITLNLTVFSRAVF
jgi:hypothetical protein